MTNIGIWLKQQRESLGWSQTDLSWESRVAATSISQFERGNFQPNIKTLERLSDALVQGRSTGGEVAVDQHEKFRRDGLLRETCPWCGHDDTAHWTYTGLLDTCEYCSCEKYREWLEFLARLLDLSGSES